MPSVVTVAIPVMLLLPAMALAHSGGPDPNLHVDPRTKDCEVSFAPELTQGAFRRFAREFGSASAFKMGSPPTTLGRLGVSVAVEYLSFRVEEHSDAWNDTFSHPDSDHELGAEKAFPKLTVRVGVTDALDVAAFYSENPNANYGWLGFEAKYGMLRQGEDMPVSVALRGAYTRTLYVADMDMDTFSVGASVGRTFWKVLTPYAGVGADAVLARETSAAVDLENEAPIVPYGTAGVEVRWWRLAVGAEAQLSALTTYQLQVAAVF